MYFEGMHAWHTYYIGINSLSFLSIEKLLDKSSLYVYARMIYLNTNYKLTALLAVTTNTPFTSL